MTVTKQNNCDHIWGDENKHGEFPCTQCDVKIKLIDDSGLRRYWIYTPDNDIERILVDVLIENAKVTYLGFALYEKNKLHDSSSEVQERKLNPHGLPHEIREGDSIVTIPVPTSLSEVENYLQKYADERQLTIERVIPAQGPAFGKFVDSYIKGCACCVDRNNGDN